MGGLAKPQVELLSEDCAELQGVLPRSAPYHLMEQPESHSHLLQLSLGMRLMAQKQACFADGAGLPGIDTWHHGVLCWNRFVPFKTHAGVESHSEVLRMWKQSDSSVQGWSLQGVIRIR